jgi:hypothetical protein
MFRIVATVLAITGKLDVAFNERFASMEEALDFGRMLAGSSLPEIGGVVDWSIDLFRQDEDGPTLLETWTMDDDQPYYDHRILIRDNMDAAHYKAHMAFMRKSDDS